MQTRRIPVLAPLHGPRIRAALALRGLNPRSWATERGFSDKTVYALLSGTRSGARSPEIVDALRALEKIHA